MLMRRLLVFFVLLTGIGLAADAQILVSNDSITRYDTDSLRRAYDSGPYFTFYKDNYFAFGTSVGSKPTKANTNIKFQISIQQKLTRSTLPWGTYLYLFYTQKAFWNILQRSAPFYDLNFNPGIGWAKPFFSSRTGRYMGKMMLILEHESNGRDGDASRSWNRVSLAGNVLLDKNIMVHAKAWIPIVDGQQNRDILHYIGVYQCGLQVMSNDRRFGASVVLTKRCDWNPVNFNTQIELKYRIFPKDNQYLFVQYYNGYGEGLLDYNRFHSQIRVGICLSPTFFSEY